jgi:signal transduction histidine kinase
MRQSLPYWLKIALALAFAGAAASRGTEAQPPLRSINSLSSLVGPREGESVVLRGVVTLVRRSTIYVQDQTGAVAVYPNDPPRLALGDEVEIQGVHRPGAAAGSVVAEARVRRLWSGSPPIPLALRPDQAAEGAFGYRLVEIEGQLLQKTQGQRHLRLTLDGDNQLFAATLELSAPLSPDSQLPKKLEEGSTLRLTGVFTPRTNQEDSADAAFGLMLRSTDDIRVIRPAPWWNVRHSAWVGLGAMAVLFMLHRLRVRSLHQRFQAVVEERLRIAREMHDTLAQGFVGLTYQLEGIARELNAVPDSDSMQRSLSLALQLVRHSREEAHGSISALRSLAHADPDLLRLLLQSAGIAAAGRDVRILSSQLGKPLPIPDETANQLLRIGQEAITNALRHSSPTEITIAVHYGADDVTLQVKDNGHGISPACVLSPDFGHFGILGMKERARRIQAVFDIASREGEGTTVSVRARIGNRSSWRNRLLWLRPPIDTYVQDENTRNR